MIRFLQKALFVCGCLLGEGGEGLFVCLLLLFLLLYCWLFVVVVVLLGFFVWLVGVFFGVFLWFFVFFFFFFFLSREWKKELRLKLFTAGLSGRMPR